MEMRKFFSNELEKYMIQNSNIVVLNADLAKPNGFQDLSIKYPDRVFNVGIAEQNMACMAAGMSSYGFIPFICSFTPFATRRICDQIAISICYANQNVKIIGTDPGLTAEYNGGTHMSVEDIGVLRSIPNIVIFEPVDNNQLKYALPEILKYNGPVYIRMLRKEAPDIINNSSDFNLFGSKIIKTGTDVTIFCSGIMTSEAIRAGEILESQNISTEIINIHTIKPIDKSTVIKSAQKTKAVITAENHNIIGGLYSAVCEVLSENCPVPVKSIGIKDTFGQVGKLDYLKSVYNMQADDIVKSVHEVLKLKKRRAPRELTKKQVKNEERGR